MNRALRARLWLATATAGAVVLVVSIAGMLRSCQIAHAAACVTSARVDHRVAQLRADFLVDHTPRRSAR